MGIPLIPHPASDLQNAGTDVLKILADSAKDLAPCGAPVVKALERILHSMQRNVQRLESNQPAVDTASIQFRCGMLKEQANEMIATFPYADVPAHWRQLYMDAALLNVAASLMAYTGASEVHGFNSGEGIGFVRILDMANIVTAFFDNGRGDALARLMHALQAEMKHSEEGYEDDESGGLDAGARMPRSPDDQHTRKKQRTDGTAKERAIEEQELDIEDVEEKPTILLPSIREIKRYTLDNAPDMGDIDNETEPFIVSGAISDWPAIAWDDCAWRSPSYLRKIAGKGRIVPVEVGSSYTSEGWTQKMMQFEEFLENIHWRTGDRKKERKRKASNNSLPLDGATELPPTLYLAQHDLFQQFHELLKDTVTPDYCFAAPGAPLHYPDYRPPASEAGYITNAWMGPKGTYSPAHTDPYYNCYAQVVGSKHIWIVPPECSNTMETLNDRSTHHEQEDKDGDESADSRNEAAQQYMSNTTNADVFALSSSTAKSGSPPSDAFATSVLPKAQQAILEEGDLLFMPPKWWHSLKSLERSFSVSFWF